jgi:MmyB-like transcription regulator ligand binding domain
MSPRPLRLRHGTRQGDRSLEALLSALRGASRDFSRLWNENRTLPLQTAIVRMRHQIFGTIKVATVRFLLPADPDCFLATLAPVDPKTVAAFVSYAAVGPP